MSTKHTLAEVESLLSSALHGYKASAGAVKAAHRTAYQAIKADTRRSDVGKKEAVDGLRTDTRAKLDAIRAEQDSYVKTLRDGLERELRGNQPADASSVLLRRDASDRTRKLADKDEAASMLRDAIRNGDSEMAHALGTVARNRLWEDVTTEYKSAYPETAESAAALAHVESATTGAAMNVANSATYSMPLD